MIALWLIAACGLYLLFFAKQSTGASLFAYTALVFCLGYLLGRLL